MNVKSWRCKTEGKLEKKTKHSTFLFLNSLYLVCLVVAIQFFLFVWQYIQQMSHGVQYFAGNVVLFVLTGLYVGICFNQPKYRCAYLCFKRLIFVSLFRLLSLTVYKHFISICKATSRCATSHGLPDSHLTNI